MSVNSWKSYEVELCFKLHFLLFFFVKSGYNFLELLYSVHENLKFLGRVRREFIYPKAMPKRFAYQIQTDS